MSNRCTACNAVVDEGMKICPNCGRLISSIGDRHEYQPQRPGHARPAGTGAQRRKPGSPPQQRSKPRPAQHSTPQPGQNVRKKRPPQKQPPRKAEAELPGWTAVIRRVVVIAIILAAVYFALFGLQVLRVRHSSYQFNTQMKLSSANYGEAFDSSVKDGGWSYNPFTFSLTYKGVHNGSDIVVRFSAGINVRVKSITVGEEEKTDEEQIHNCLMGLFI